MSRKNIDVRKYVVITFFDGIQTVTRCCICGSVCFMAADHYDDGTHQLLYTGRDKQRVVDILNETGEMTELGEKEIIHHQFIM